MKKSTVVIRFVALGLAMSSTYFAQTGEKTPRTNLTKTTVEEIITKHKDSIGSSTAIAAAKSKVFVGVGTLTSKAGYAGKLGGPLQFAAESDKLLVAMIFNSNDYPHEKLGYNGKDLSTGLVEGSPTILGNFLKSNSVIVKKGLFAGVLRSDWLLLNQAKGVKLEYDGLSRIGQTNVHKVKLTTSGLGNLIVNLYFDAQTFRHLRTDYNYSSSELMGPSPNRVGMPTIGGVRRYSVTESFTNFTRVGELTLPLTYVIEYESPEAEKSLIWTLNFTQAYYNETLDPSVFRVS